MSVQLVLKRVGASAAPIEVSIDCSATVLELKEQIADRAGLPVEHIRLVCAGRIWQDVCAVGSYEPQDGAIVHLLSNPPRSQPAAAEQVPQAANPMQQMLGGGMQAAAPAAAGGDPMAQMMAQSQQMMMQSPELMQQIMQSPMVQQMMSDPETVRAMMRMHPQLNQLMEERPEIGRMLEDPEVLQQSMRMMANPSLMREMTRNADRAIGNLDAMPGGHSALVQAHQEFADPIFEALAGPAGGAAAQNAAAYAQQTAGLPNSEALPNPWGGPAPAPATPVQAPGGPQAALQQPLGAFPGAAVHPGPAPQGGDPMGVMMQQMLSNPAQMQQMMYMTQQLFGGGAGAARLRDAPTETAGPAAGAPPPNPMAALTEQTLGSSAQAQPAGPPTNPMAVMMQQMMADPAQMQQAMAMTQQLFGGVSGNGALAAPPAAAGPGASAAAPADPMAAMMQQMMADPAHVQRTMSMAQQLFGGGADEGALAWTPAAAGAGASAAPPADPATALMHQMMSNPAQMQQAAGMAQQLLGGGGFGGAAPARATPAPAAEQGVADLSVQRGRFAQQLSQLMAMGFTNEALCLRVLAEHNGRIDAAIDALLASGGGSA
eukprot:CAMPEP_0175357898 /NCGR_PEP_ID=MMETSP0095-20121207/14722_1 /TAXON_ID=311494 /ORGANISM="Alexandrium monilatum, Strain CCMP3105" /LENGTH=600 /DNA_ID=CAMNT_0016655615 /DNA_START=74 /DNA_END=1876 /DNA_ORIENTATION=+